ncbi:hypothetical protein PV08_02297 [Exophiala spinifera]|uniref:FAD dependent oxidoreductase domain-containing protein n=1 Tax=Exophiala spinifera TaxID=91928 RepID=A0A0D2BHE9_9EURO|nr:uncharacterized protein PV08_02297 [Exophiala spinifera]KIW18010.1 hypothetical protein PV08_02297 [Exophiala spinifera]
MSQYLPVKNGLKSFWFREPQGLENHRTTESIPSHADVVIIGAGYAGAATAYHLVRDFPEISSITILEAREACSGATGRNGGHLRPDLYGHIPTYIDRYGVELASEIAEFEIANMWAIKKVIEDEQIDCDLTLQRSIDVWCNEEAADNAIRTYQKMRAYNLDYMKDVFFTRDPKTAEGYSGIKGAKAAASFTAGTMWPAKFIQGLLKVVLATGRVNLQTNTPVTSVQADSSHGWTVHTDRGSICASRVVHATNGYVASLLPQYDHNVVPCKGICCHIAAPVETESSAPLLNNSYIIRDEDKALSYLIPRTDGGIVVGGAAAKFSPFREQWYRNVDDGVLIDAAKDYYNNYMQRTFNGWEKYPATITDIWTGVMGYSFDSHPHIGAVPGLDGQFVNAGFNGHGMPLIWLGSKGVAKLVAAHLQGRELPFTETGIPRLFETSQARIDRAVYNSEEEGDILGTGQIFLPRTAPGPKDK